MILSFRTAADAEKHPALLCNIMHESLRTRFTRGTLGAKGIPCDIDTLRATLTAHSIITVPLMVVARKRNVARARAVAIASDLVDHQMAAVALLKARVNLAVAVTVQCY
jgi:hypothetical protein